MIITRSYLRKCPDKIFVFGDNTKRYGMAGASILRDEPNTYGFITKKRPSNNPEDFYTIREYVPIFKEELQKLINEIESNPNKTYLISKIGSGLANRNLIFEVIIEPRIKGKLKRYDNVRFLW